MTLCWTINSSILLLTVNLRKETFRPVYNYHFVKIIKCIQDLQRDRFSCLVLWSKRTRKMSKRLHECEFLWHGVKSLTSFWSWLSMWWLTQFLTFYGRKIMYNLFHFNLWLLFQQQKIFNKKPKQTSETEGSSVVIERERTRIKYF